MPYVPKNRIETDLYTSGGEYVFRTSRESYTGYYHRYYDGKFYTGKTPDDQFIKELIILDKIEQEDTGLDIEGAFFPEDPDPIIDKEKWDPGLNNTYTYLRTGNTGQGWKQKLPQLYLYTPSDQDYQVGEIIRYFTKKTNELKYTEVDQQTYQNFFNQQTGYAWEFYIAFQLPWQISGERQEVETTNRNITQLTQRRLEIQGLPEYLKYDYLKFYKGS